MRVVALGDSTSCGEGVGLRVPARCTWPALLCAQLPGTEVTSVAVAGAGVRDVRAAQLPLVLASDADLCTLLIGLNDVSRGGFERSAFAADLRAVVDGLRTTGALVLLATLHDPTAVLPLPSRLRAAVQERIAAANDAVLDCVGEEVLLLDLAALTSLRQRRMWDVDRVHPNVAGHAAIAAAAADVLRTAGHRVGAVPQPEGCRSNDAVREARWTLRHGLPWLGRHLPQVVGPAIRLAVTKRT